MKCLLKSVREYKKPSILAPIFIALEVIVECTIPYVMTLLLGKINTVPTDALMGEVLKFGGLLIFLALLSLCCGALAGRFCAVASSGFAKNLRKPARSAEANPVDAENPDHFRKPRCQVPRKPPPVRPAAQPPANIRSALHTETILSAIRNGTACVRRQG